MQRVEEINNNDYYLYRVSKILLFGSYINKDAVDFGDVDIAFELERKTEDADEYERLNKEFVEIAKGLPNNMKAISRTENTAELATLYSAATVFVNPTYVDNFPTTNIEALACGTPVITYRTGGSIEAVNKRTGLIVEKGDVDELKVAIEEIVNNGKDFYKDACRERAVKFYNKDDRFEDYIELFERLLRL